jgi:hypothetical protein
MLPSFPSLTDLILTAEGPMLGLGALCSCALLQRLVIQSKAALGPVAVAQLAAALQQQPLLDSLQLHGCNLGAADLATLTPALHTLSPRLRHLQLAGNPALGGLIEDVALAHLLAPLSNLLNLDLSNNRCAKWHCSAVCVPAVCSPMPGCPSRVQAGPDMGPDS